MQSYGGGERKSNFCEISPHFSFFFLSALSLSPSPRFYRYQRLLPFTQSLSLSYTFAPPSLFTRCTLYHVSLEIRKRSLLLETTFVLRSNRQAQNIFRASRNLPLPSLVSLYFLSRSFLTVEFHGFPKLPFRFVSLFVHR